jgi:hypothetical protein
MQFDPVRGLPMLQRIVSEHRLIWGDATRVGQAVAAASARIRRCHATLYPHRSIDKLCDTYSEGRWQFVCDGPHKGARIMEVFAVRKDLGV